MASRELSSGDKRALQEAWPGASLVSRHTVLGTLIGHNVTVEDFVQAPLSKALGRLRLYKNLHMSLTMRILAVNVYVYPVLSYVAHCPPPRWYGSVYPQSCFAISYASAFLHTECLHPLAYTG